MPPVDAEPGTITACAPLSTAIPDRSFTLAILGGPDKGRRLVLDGAQPSRILIGQSEVCELRVSDREVSRRHAALEHLGPSIRLTDLGSTNGTYVDRVRIVEAILTGGEILRMGTTLVRVEDGPTLEAPSVLPGAAFGRVVGVSRALVGLYPVFERLARTQVPVVIEGETGTGKEALAEALHEQGPRAKQPFIIFDCTAVPHALIESELFGHERGAFTGATSTRRGVFEQAHGGTLFIDEIGDLDLTLQPKLLRAIERSEFRRVGGEAWVSVDVRILAATRRDLDREVEAGRFREDLFHRLAVARVELPPLRNRKGDIPVLAAHFWQQMGGNPGALADAIVSKWEASSWPGNVRELRNAVARHLALGDLTPGPPAPSTESDASASEWALLLHELTSSKLPFPEARDRVLELFTAQYVTNVLRAHGGSIARAAASSGIGRRYFEKLRARKAER
jgi:two-component system response regulator HydG